MTKTTIEWAEEVWNPVTGCTKVSQGCKNCYAERIAGRFWGARKFTDVDLHPERLEAPLHWKKPRRVFVNSMSDLFHPSVPYSFLDQVWHYMAEAQQHIFIILTKRPELLYKYTKWQAGGDDISVAEWPRNVWLGVSVENQQAADERIPLLLLTPAAVRFVSVEPMLGAVDLRNVRPANFKNRQDDVLTGKTAVENSGLGAIYEGGKKLDWVITGCESGPGARPFDMDWARGLRDQCQAAGVPFFFKQGRVDGKIVKMPELDGKIWAEYPAVKQ